MRSKKKDLLFGVGGVALADILANSVVVLLVVIIITISVTKHKTQQEVEQSAEISAILARDIASTLVFNDLPSSPPAVLHNYNCQRPNGPWRSEFEKHDCRAWLYPVIEFHSSYLREANNNRIFTREALLEENNELDAYLRTLPPQVKQRIRADIYHLDLYYLGISIMRENNARPNHWHFVGEDFQPEDVLGYLDRREDDHEDEDTDNATGFNQGDGEQDGGEQDGGEQDGEEGNAGEQESNQASTEAEGNQLDEIGIIPDDVSLRSAERIDSLLPPTEGRLSRNGAQRQERNQQLSEIEGEFGGNSEDGEYSDDLANALLEAIVDERSGGGDEFGRPSSVKIRLPGANRDGNSKETSLFGAPLDTIINSIALEDGTPLDYHVFMIIMVMEYLKQSNDLGFDRITIQEVFAQIRSGKIDIARHPLLPFAMELRDKMQIAFTVQDAPIETRPRLCIDCLSSMSFHINNPLSYVELNTANPQRFFQDTSIINTRLQFYRYLDLGDETEILKSDTILMDPDTLGKGWHTIAILDPNISDLVVGYVYGDVSGDILNVVGDVNLLKLDSQVLWSELSFYPLRREIVFGVLYGFLTLAILMVFLYISVGFRRRVYG